MSRNSKKRRHAKIFASIFPGSLFTPAPSGVSFEKREARRTTVFGKFGYLEYSTGYYSLWVQKRNGKYERLFCIMPESVEQLLQAMREAGAVFNSQVTA